MKEDPEPRAPSGNPRQEPAEFRVRNLQRRVRVDGPGLRAFFRSVVDEARPDAPSATLVLVSDERMRALNRFFRGKDRPTDVLSFSAGESVAPGEAPYLGDIVISVETAEKRAASRGTELGRQLKLLALHGFLHLLGHDHEKDGGEMKRLEYRLRRRLGITGAASGGPSTNSGRSRKKK